MTAKTPAITEALEHLEAVMLGKGTFPTIAVEIALRHLPDERTMLHSTRVATRAVKRYHDYPGIPGIITPHNLAAVGLLHDVLEDSCDPFGAAMEIAAYLYPDSAEAKAVLLLTRSLKDTDATYFARLAESDNLLAFLIKVEDAHDNTMDARGVFTGRRMARFAMKTALYVMPLVRLYAPKMVPVFEKELMEAVSRVDLVTPL